MFRRSRQFSYLFGVLALPILPGCLSGFNPVPNPPRETKEFCQQLPLSCREKLCVIFFNGVDPFECGNIPGVRDYLNGLGFVKTYYGQLYHQGILLKELQVIHADHPDAKFAVIGFEFGAVPARKLARQSNELGLPIDLLVYLQPKGLDTFADLVEPQVGRRITIQGYGESANDDGEVISVPSYFRYSVPTNAATLETLMTELTNIALAIPQPARPIDTFPTLLDDPAPTPRPTVQRQPEPMDEWDFLKPASQPRIRETLPMPTIVSETRDTWSQSRRGASSQDWK